MPMNPTSTGLTLAAGFSFEAEFASANKYGMKTNSSLWPTSERSFIANPIRSSRTLNSISQRSQADGSIENNF